MDEIEQAFHVDQVSIRLVKDAPLLGDEPLNSPEKVVEKLAGMMSEFDREVVGVINFRSDMTPINIHFASMGSINEAVAHPREIMKAAILSNASNMMLLHNHPSGNLEPSKEDTMLTDRMNRVCELMGIPLTDHIIVGGDNTRFFSFKQKEMMPMPSLRLKSDYKSVNIGSVAEKREYQAKGEKLPTQVRQITEKLEQGIKDLFQSDTYKNYLKTMSKFHSYSFNNTLLIAMQKPDATMVAGYTAWQNNFKRHVKKGEKGIKIIAPSPYKKKALRDVIDPDTNQPKLDKEGKKEQEEVEVKIPAFKVVTVFDASQTEGKPLPTLGVNELDGSMDGYKDFMKALEKISPVPMEYQKIESGAKGYFSPAEQKIVLKEGMSEQQTVKTAVHELAHSLLHDKDNMRMEGLMDERKKNRETKEVEAESVAYTVCQHFGIDTSEYSFGYLAGWSSGKELPELKESMETIRTTASKVITDLEDALTEIRLERKQEIEQKVTLYVAECSEFHSLGEYKEGIETVDEAIHVFHAIPSERMNGIKAIGIKVENVDDAMDSIELDIVVGNHIDVDMLSYVPEVRENEVCRDMIARMIVAMPQMEVRGEIPKQIAERIDKIREEHRSMEETLAIKIDAFAKGYDPYGYADDVEDSDANISMMVTDMKNGEVQYLADYLMNAIRDEDGIVSEQIEAQKLLKELKEMVCDIEVNEELLTPPAESVQEQTIYHSEDVIESYRAKTMEVFHELDGENAESIEKMVKAKAQDIMDTMGIDAQIVDAVLIGSRSRGIRQEDGNVELVVDIKGEVPKEEIAGILNGENIEIAGQKVVMETIVNDQPMPLADFLQHTESSLMAQQKQEVEEATTKEEREETKRAVKETGKYANFKMVKGNQDQRYYLFADVKYPSGEIVKERPIAEFPNKKVCEQFCMKNRIRAEDLTGSLKKKIEHKLQLRVDTESNKKEQSKSRSGSIEDD